MPHITAARLRAAFRRALLRCKTPAMVLKEIWTHLLAYYMVRTLMARTADETGIEPREWSFAGTVQAVKAFVPELQLIVAADQDRLLRILLRIIARHRVGDRPDRYEPRAVKRRSKPIALLTVPRDQMREQPATKALAKG